MLVVSNFFPPKMVGGAELVAYKQAKALGLKGNTVEVVTIGGTNSPNEAFISVNRISESELGSYSEVALLDNLHSNASFDLVLVHNLRGFSNEFINKLRKIPGEMRIFHHDYFFICRNGIKMDSENSICNSVNSPECECSQQIGAADMRIRNDHFRTLALSAVSNFAPSEYVAEKISTEFNLPIQFRSNGYPLFPEHSIAAAQSACMHGEETYKFIFSGYLGRHKGCDLVLKALAKMPKGGWCFTILGDGPYLDQFKKIARKNPSIHVFGRVDPVTADELIRESDSLVFPSMWSENEPLTILQSMRNGKNIIASNFGAMAEILTDSPAHLFLRGDAAELALSMKQSMDQGRKVHDYRSDRIQDFGDVEPISDVSYSTVDRYFSIGVTGSFDTWHPKYLKEFADLNSEYIFHSVNNLNSSIEDLSAVLVVGQNYNSKIIFEALKSSKLILPSDILFGPEWSDSNIFRYRTITGLKQLLAELITAPTLPNKPLNSQILSSWLDRSKFLKSGDKV